MTRPPDQDSIAGDPIVDGPRDDVANEPPPAPVATDRGMIGTPPTLIEDFDDPFAGPRRAAVWLMGALLTIAIALWLALLSAAQATGEQAALPALERGVTVLTELDALVEAQAEALAEQAADGSTVRLAGFPLRDVDVPVDEVTSDGAFDLSLARDAFLSRAAQRIYTRGTSAFEGGDEIAAGASIFSAAGGIKLVLNTLSSDNHGRVTVWLWPAGAACLVLGALLLAAGIGFGRFVAFGVTLILGSLPVLLAALALRFALAVAAPDGDRVVDEFVAIARQFTALPVRNALWTAGAGLAIAVPVAILDAVFEHSVKRPPSDGRAIA
ncbi:MAG: hypothetical protein V3S31_00965 [Dehalococcoidia bacterium]